MQPSGTNNFFGIKVSKAGIPVNQASDKQLTYKDDFSTKTYYDNVNARMLEGLLPDGTYGLWVSKPGFDVTSPNAPINNQLVFNSSQDIFKIILTGNINVTFANSGSIITVPHNLGFAPAYQAFIIFSGNALGIGTGSLVTSPPYPVSSLSVTDPNLYFFVDSVNVYLLVPAIASGDAPFAVRYYLQQETIPLTL